MAGLTKNQKDELRFVRHLVMNVKEFNSEKYFDMEKEYQKHDVDIHKIMHSSRVKAENAYDDYLDKKVLKVGGNVGLGFESVEQGESLGIDKVRQKLRVQASNDREFREDFLAPQISQTAIEYDKVLKKAFREQKREEKERAGRSFPFGWSR